MVTRRRNMCRKTNQRLRTTLNIDFSSSENHQPIRIRLKTETISLMSCQQDSSSHYQVQQCQRQHHLPSIGHQLVITRSRQCCAQENEAANKDKCFTKKTTHRRKYGT